MLSQFLAECAAVQAEHGCGMALIVLRVLKYGSEKRLLDLSLHHFIQLGASLTFEGFEKVPSLSEEDTNDERNRPGMSRNYSV